MDQRIARARAESNTSIVMIDEGKHRYWEVVHRGIPIKYDFENDAKKNYEICILADVDELMRIFRGS